MTLLTSDNWGSTSCEGKFLSIPAIYVAVRALQTFAAWIEVLKIIFTYSGQST